MAWLIEKYIRRYNQPKREDLWYFVRRETDIRKAITLCREYIEREAPVITHVKVSDEYTGKRMYEVETTSESYPHVVMGLEEIQDALALRRPL